MYNIHILCFKCQRTAKAIVKLPFEEKVCCVLCNFGFLCALAKEIKQSIRTAD